MAKPCKYCYSLRHASFRCFRKRHSVLKLESSKSRLKRQKTAAIWFRQNPPDEDGYWDCYLQISTLCPKRLNRSMITLEHVKPKKRFPELKYEVDNIRPSCSFCNKLKNSKTVEELMPYFPHLVKYHE